MATSWEEEDRKLRRMGQMPQEAPAEASLGLTWGLPGEAVSWLGRQEPWLSRVTALKEGYAANRTELPMPLTDPRDIAYSRAFNRARARGSTPEQQADAQLLATAARNRVARESFRGAAEMPLTSRRPSDQYRSPVYDPNNPMGLKAPLDSIPGLEGRSMARLGGVINAGMRPPAPPSLMDRVNALMGQLPQGGRFSRNPNANIEGAKEDLTAARASYLENARQLAAESAHKTLPELTRARQELEQSLSQAREGAQPYKAPGVPLAMRIALEMGQANRASAPRATAIEQGYRQRAYDDYVQRQMTEDRKLRLQQMGLTSLEARNSESAADHANHLQQMERVLGVAQMKYGFARDDYNSAMGQEYVGSSGIPMSGDEANRQAFENSRLGRTILGDMMRAVYSGDREMEAARLRAGASGGRGMTESNWMSYAGDARSLYEQNLEDIVASQAGRFIDRNSMNLPEGFKGTAKEILELVKTGQLPQFSQQMREKAEALARRMTIQQMSGIPTGDPRQTERTSVLLGGVPTGY